MVVSEKYRLDRKLGQGGMGEVFLASHIELGRRVAIKFLRVTSAAGAEVRERFKREARAAATLLSDHIAQVFDVGELPDGCPFMVMEYLEGQDLETLLQARGPLPVAEVIGLLQQACEGVAVAHAAGIVHRDLKPANLFLVPRAGGSPLLKVLDFGIAKTIEETASRRRPGAPAPGTPVSSLTSAESLLGSVRYMAPEQMEAAHSVDARADVWSLGVIGYRLLTGRYPFNGDRFEQIFAAVHSVRPAPIWAIRSDVPSALAEAIDLCLQTELKLRLPSVTALQTALHRPIATGLAANGAPWPPVAAKPGLVAPPPPPPPPIATRAGADPDATPPSGLPPVRPDSSGPPSVPPSSLRPGSLVPSPPPVPPRGASAVPPPPSVPPRSAALTSSAPGARPAAFSTSDPGSRSPALTSSAPGAPASPDPVSPGEPRPPEPTLPTIHQRVPARVLPVAPPRMGRAWALGEWLGVLLLTGLIGGVVFGGVNFARTRPAAVSAVTVALMSPGQGADPSLPASDLHHVEPSDLIAFAQAHARELDSSASLRLVLVGRTDQGAVDLGSPSGSIRYLFGLAGDLRHDVAVDVVSPGRFRAMKTPRGDDPAATRTPAREPRCKLASAWRAASAGRSVRRLGAASYGAGQPDAWSLTMTTDQGDVTTDIDGQTCEVRRAASASASASASAAARPAPSPAP